MNTYQILINQNEDLSWIIQAAQELVVSTESDLKAIKAKKWYDQLLETITFSQGDKIQTAKDIGTLAKLQEIVIRILVMLSQENAAISTAVREQTELLKGLQIQDAALLAAIKKIKFGGTDQLSFAELPQEKKALLANLVIMADPEEERNDYSRRYIASIMRIAGIGMIDNTLHVEVVESLNKKQQELLYQMIMINRYLRDIDSDEEDEVIDCISISPKRAKQICAAIESTAENVAPDFFVTYYEDSAENVNVIGDDDIQFIADSEQGNTNNGTCHQCMETEWNAIVEEMKKFEDNCFVSDIFGIFIFDYDMVGFDYSTKSYTVMIAEQELRKVYDPMKSKLNLNNSGNLADMAFTHARVWLEVGFEDLRNQIRHFGERTGLTHCAQDMESVLDEEQFYDRIRALLEKELRENAHEYSLDSFSHYFSLVEIENDDMSIETGFRRIFEKLTTTWSYTIDDSLECDYMYVMAQFASAANRIIRRTLNAEVFSKIRKIYTEQY